MSFHVASKGVAVSLQLLKAPVIGEIISFYVTITNNEVTPKELKKHVNAQNKEYNRNPTGTFWEAHDDVKIGPNESKNPAKYTYKQSTNSQSECVLHMYLLKGWTIWQEYYDLFHNLIMIDFNVAL